MEFTGEMGKSSLWDRKSSLLGSNSSLKDPKSSLWDRKSSFRASNSSLWYRKSFLFASISSLKDPKSSLRYRKSSLQASNSSLWYRKSYLFASISSLKDPKSSLRDAKRTCFIVHYLSIRLKAPKGTLPCPRLFLFWWGKGKGVRWNRQFYYPLFSSTTVAPIPPSFCSAI